MLCFVHGGYTYEVRIDGPDESRLLTRTNNGVRAVMFFINSNEEQCRPKLGERLVALEVDTGRYEVLIDNGYKPPPTGEWLKEGF